MNLTSVLSWFISSIFNRNKILAHSWPIYFQMTKTAQNVSCVGFVKCAISVIMICDIVLFAVNYDIFC